LLRQTAIGSFRIKTVFLKYIMWDFLKITIIQYADVVTVTYRRIVAVQALDEKNEPNKSARQTKIRPVSF